MDRTYIEDQEFEKVDFTATRLVKGEYDNCTFTGCNFEKLNLSGFTFAGCTFTGCNLSLVMLGATVLRQVVFTGCKLVGLHFEHCSNFLFSPSFQNCILTLSSFYGATFKKARFVDCTLNEVDFSEAELSGALFQNCNLAGALFERTKLENADLRSAYNYTIDPALNGLRKAKFSLAGLPGLLHQYDIEIE